MPDDPPSPYDVLAENVDTPMTVVTAAAGGERAGCVVGFAVQCSIDPVRHLVCLSKANRTYEVACAVEWLVVHALHARDREIAKLFGETTDRDVDKFAHIGWHPGPGGVPVIDDCDWFAGRVVERVDLGDHEGFVLDVGVEGSAARAREPRLGFQWVRDLEAGNPA